MANIANKYATLRKAGRRFGWSGFGIGPDRESRPDQYR
jgi:hypothetical protein